MISLFTSSGAFVRRTRDLAPMNEMRVSGTTKGAMLAERRRSVDHQYPDTAAGGRCRRGRWQPHRTY
ncbi:MAG: hypothetical protein IPP90_10195 [Gemmatimonadaceae bacterium]|nr:hypothetical protein [Gemmatimonadaceae bacterium]